jgi:hypothetical protein
MSAGMKSISASVAAGENTPHLDLSDSLSPSLRFVTALYRFQSSEF